MKHLLHPIVTGVMGLVLCGCGPTQHAGQNLQPQPLQVRAQRRAFAGAPPVIPHPPLTGTCTTCHTPQGGHPVPGVGIAPANPHTETPGLSAQARCKQCHVFQETDEAFVSSEFVAWRRDEPSGQRAHPLAPPTIPHRHFMREDCRACHAGPAARPEIVCDHAERLRCRQCHVTRNSPTPEDMLVGEQFSTLTTEH